MSWDERDSQPSSTPAHLSHHPPSPPPSLPSDHHPDTIPRSSHSEASTPSVATLPLKRSDSFSKQRSYESRFALEPSFRDHLQQRPPDSPPPHQMPHRVDSAPTMTLPHRRATAPYDRYARRHSPPPIATLSQSPSLSVSSLDRSNVSSPVPGRRSPPHNSHGAPAYPPSSYYSPYHPAHIATHHSTPASRDNNHPRSYSYSGHPSFDHRREPQPDPYQGYPPPHPTVPSMNHPSVAPQYLHPGHSNHPIVYTDDAATKLSDRTRRRCFNCQTTDTSTWRRSNLNPGKVLCNKCGLFERTHSRPRPDQFPHRRGPLATSSLRGRTPPPTQLPPISSTVHSLAPYQYHPSIAPLASVPDTRRSFHSNTLPDIQSWHDAPASTSPSSTPPMARRNSRGESS